ncbi:sulfotransferase family 2 domain-containing protein [Demequina iriomotensis]|uniref:sulfotransferase family 2 domain-containing protein n=1 Tax=Demequina iriomotensis TaxID=1536641 RepID=UPI000784D311|nr:sulfotransferase family 2 domain-containing protein [Demequina iriomotensis]
MIVSHEHRYIFVRTRKTAGSSLELALSATCGPDDIVTPHPGDENDELREAVGGSGAQNYLIPYHRYTTRNVATLVVKRRRPELFDHMPARRIRSTVGSEVWNSYFKFAFVRNPWDAVISMYYWTHQGPDRPPMDAFLASEACTRLQRNVDIFTIDGEVAVDRLFRFEDLRESAAEIGARLELGEPLELPRAKSSHRADRRAYRDVLTDTQIARIGEMFGRELEITGYVP